MNNAVDFDDLLVEPLRLFREYPHVLREYQDRFEHLLIDEYQDTNHAQYLLVKNLASQHHNVCAVGDDDQSIYGWRGADISNILNFERDYPEAKVVRLEQNYRSTKCILAAAGAVVKQNSKRKTKDLWTENDEGDKIQVAQLMDERNEAAWIRSMISEEVSSGRKLRRYRHPLSHQCTVARDRGGLCRGRRADTICGCGRCPFLRACGDQGRSGVSQGDREPARYAEPVADRQRAEARDRCEDGASSREARGRAGHLASGRVAGCHA